MSPLSFLREALAGRSLESVPAPSSSHKEGAGGLLSLSASQLPAELDSSPAPSQFNPSTQNGHLLQLELIITLLLASVGCACPITCYLHHYFHLQGLIMLGIAQTHSPCLPRAYNLMRHSQYIPSLQMVTQGRERLNDMTKVTKEVCGPDRN